MSTGNIPADEVDIDVLLVRRLLAVRFPHWPDVPLAPVPSAGTDNALYRLDTEMVVRLPRIDWAVGGVDKERTKSASGSLPRLALHLPARIAL